MTLVPVVTRLHAEWLRDIGHPPASIVERTIETAFLTVITKRSLAIDQATAIELTASDPTRVQALRTWLESLAERVIDIQGRSTGCRLPAWPDLVNPSPRRKRAPSSTAPSPSPRTIRLMMSSSMDSPPPAVLVVATPSFAPPVAPPPPVAIIPARSPVLWMLDARGAEMTDDEVGRYLDSNDDAVVDACMQALARVDDLSAPETAACMWLTLAQTEMAYDTRCRVVRAILTSRLSRAVVRCTDRPLGAVQMALLTGDDTVRGALMSVWCAPYSTDATRHSIELTAIVDDIASHQRGTRVTA